MGPENASCIEPCRLERIPPQVADLLTGIRDRGLLEVAAAVP